MFSTNHPSEKYPKEEHARSIIWGHTYDRETLLKYGKAEKVPIRELVASFYESCCFKPVDWLHLLFVAVRVVIYLINIILEV